MPGSQCDPSVRFVSCSNLANACSASSRRSTFRQKFLPDERVTCCDRYPCSTSQFNASAASALARRTATSSNRHRKIPSQLSAVCGFLRKYAKISAFNFRFLSDLGESNFRTPREPVVWGACKAPSAGASVLLHLRRRRRGRSAPFAPLAFSILGAQNSEQLWSVEDGKAGPELPGSGT